MTKTMSFAAVHFTVAFTVAWLMTGSVLVGGVIALVEGILYLTKTDELFRVVKGILNKKSVVFCFDEADKPFGSLY